MEFALFKFQLIAPILNDKKIEQKRYFKEMSEKNFDLSCTKQKKFSSATFKKWLYLYKKYGLDALKGTFRKDKGKTRVIDDDLKETIKNLLNEYNFKTVSNLYEYLIQQSYIYENDFTYATLNTFLKNNNMLNPSTQKKARKAFEMPHINMLWMTDFMYGPYVYSGKSKTRTYLCAIIDDYSRVIVYAQFFDSQSVYLEYQINFIVIMAVFLQEDIYSLFLQDWVLLLCILKFMMLLQEARLKDFFVP